ncbi:PT domain-containing protein [Paenibacillus glycanilyticus]|uniref:PT domain-containing protein n=1 Tax=Paenibacillus glycanilyticus TaxID=126569 RepID=UPI000FDBB161|nr:PT domain-containing protein [Paenibacillus glycanilyticus]
MWRLLSILAVMLVLGGCLGLGGNDNTLSPMPSASQTAEPSAEPSLAPTPIPSSSPTPAPTAEETAKAIMNALKQQDTEKLSSYIHPEKGLLFSPYGHIEKDAAVTFKAGELPAWDDSKLYKWGSYDGSGEPISLTFKDYFEKFVYDKNFAEAEKVGHNEILGRGNTLVNIGEIYPGSTYYDYYFSGFDQELSGMDWESLILVLEQHNGAWYVCAIVHSQWTI